MINFGSETLQISPWEIAIYKRVSSDDKQKPEDSFHRQQNDIERAFGNLYDLSQAKIYTDVESGSEINRRNYQRMLADIKKRNIRLILLSHPDRFGRDDTEALNAIDALKKSEARIYFAALPTIDPLTPAGRFVITIMFALSRHELETLRERISGGMLVRLQRGELLGKAPDGYLNVHSIDEIGREVKTIQINPKRADVIVKIFDLMLEPDMSQTKICIELDRLGYTRSTGERFYNPDHPRNIYSTSIISKILHNGTYAGWVVSPKYGVGPGMIRGTWEPLVENWKFERIQRILSGRNRGNGGTQKHQYLLQDLLYLRENPDLIKMQ